MPPRPIPPPAPAPAPGLTAADARRQVIAAEKAVQDALKRATRARQLATDRATESARASALVGASTAGIQEARNAAEARRRAQAAESAAQRYERAVAAAILKLEQARQREAALAQAGTPAAVGDLERETPFGSVSCPTVIPKDDVKLRESIDAKQELIRAKYGELKNTAYMLDKIYERYEMLRLFGDDGTNCLFNSPPNNPPFEDSNKCFENFKEKERQYRAKKYTLEQEVKELQRLKHELEPEEEPSVMARIMRQFFY